MTEPNEHPHFIVMSNTTCYDLARMYQIVGELIQPRVSVHFDPLEQPQLM